MCSVRSWPPDPACLDRGPLRLEARLCPEPPVDQDSSVPAPAFHRPAAPRVGWPGALPAPVHSGTTLGGRPRNPGSSWALVKPVDLFGEMLELDDQLPSQLWEGDCDRLDEPARAVEGPRRHKQRFGRGAAPLVTSGCLSDRGSSSPQHGLESTSSPVGAVVHTFSSPALSQTGSASGGFLQSRAPAARAVNVRPGRTALIQSCVLPPVNASGSSSPRAGTDVPAETGKAHVRL